MTEKTFTINYWTRSDARATATVTANTQAEAIEKLGYDCAQVQSVSEHAPIKERTIVRQQVLNLNGEIVEQEFYLSDEYGNPV